MFVVAAIDRIAAKELLNAEELSYLETLADQAPQAAAHAIKCLNAWLDSPDERDRQ